MAWNQILFMELAALSFFALFLYFSRTEPLRLKIKGLQAKLLTASRALTVAHQKMAADAQASAATVLRLENRCADFEVKHAHLSKRYLSLSGTLLSTPDSGSAIPVEVTEPEQTARLSPEESLQLAAQGDSAEHESGSAIPVEILDDASPTRRVLLEESELVPEPDCRLDGLTALPSEADVGFADQSYEQRAS